MEPILQLQNIDKYYGRNHVVKNLTIEVQRGEFLTVLGPSGCGKTTTLRMIAGFEIPQSGQILLEGKDITKLPPYKREVNTVFQNYALFPNMTVEQNVAYGLTQQKLSKKEVALKVDKGLETVRMSDFRRRKPQELSGGQQQRIAIARAIVNDPKILLLDEPLGALDLKLRKEMQIELKKLNHELEKTFIYVTHDQEEALTMSDRVAVMNDGVLEQISASQEIYYHPKTRFVANFIGETNIMPGLVIDDKSIELFGSTISVKTMTKTKGDKVELVVRPEDVELQEKGGILQGVIEETIFVGTLRKYSIRINDDLTMLATETTLKPSKFESGQEVSLTWNADKASIF